METIVKKSRILNDYFQVNFNPVFEDIYPDTCVDYSLNTVDKRIELSFHVFEENLEKLVTEPVNLNKIYLTIHNRAGIVIKQFALGDLEFKGFELNGSYDVKCQLQITYIWDYEKAE